jgi:hypothetical protein
MLTLAEVTPIVTTPSSSPCALGRLRAERSRRRSRSGRHPVRDRHPRLARRDGVGARDLVGCVRHRGRVAALAAGLAAYVWPGIPALALLYLIAAWAFVTGVVQISTAISMRKQISGPGRPAGSTYASVGGARGRRTGSAGRSPGAIAITARSGPGEAPAHALPGSLAPSCVAGESRNRAIAHRFPLRRLGSDGRLARAAQRNHPSTATSRGGSSGAPGDMAAGGS